MEINQLLTTYNLNKSTNREIKYLVIHYVGALGGAQANCKYYASRYIGASAHYFVGHSGEIWQSVLDEHTAWHCGAKTYYHSDCRNSNSIGIEMCVRKTADGTWYFEQETIDSTIALVKELMAKYNIPIENVLRHYDITHKICPQPYVKDENAWRDFKNKLVEKAPIKENITDVEIVNKSVDVIAKEVINGLWGNGSERKTRLAAAGYNYSEIQARVNEMLGAKKQASPLKSTDAIAKEVIKGLWGNGSERKQRLEAAGYNYRTVQKRVNQLLR